MENKKRLIDANVIPYEECYVPDGDVQWEYKKALIAEKAVIDQLPTVDAVEVVHGEWRLVKFNCGRETVFAECSVCDAVFEVSSFSLNLNYNYCPNCGAKMDGDKYE